MQFFKNIFITLILSTTLPLHAKGTGGAVPAAAPAVKQPQARPIPAPKPAAVQKSPAKPTAQTSTFQSLIAYVKNTPNAWDRANGKLSTNFINDMTKQARAAKLDALQLETLLQTARDVHGVFSGDQQKDRAILQSVATQIAIAIQ